MITNALIEFLRFLLALLTHLNKTVVRHSSFIKSLLYDTPLCTRESILNSLVSSLDQEGSHELYKKLQGVLKAKELCFFFLRNGGVKAKGLRLPPTASDLILFPSIKLDLRF